MKIMTREDDERDLRILHLHTKGMLRTHIAAQIGVCTKTVSNVITRVCNDDATHDPEAKDYWEQFA